MHFLMVMIIHLFITSYDFNGPVFKDRLCNLGAWQCIFQEQDAFLEGHDNALVYHRL